MVRITDKQVLFELARNARKPAAHIAKTIGVTEAAIRKRIKKLEDNGTITQYTKRTDPKKTDSMHVFIGIDGKPEYFMNLVKYSKEQEAVTRGHTTAGDHSIQLECIFPNNDAFVTFIQDLENQPGVVKICPGIVTNTIK